MSKANAGDNSSLELLLDTMCNTFGAVMFIAISLLVVISMLGKVTAASESLPETESLKAMQTQLARLESEYLQTRKMLDLLKPFAERLQNAPQRETLTRYLKLKEENTLLETQWKLRQLQQETSEKLKKNLQKQKEKLNSTLSRNSELYDSLTQKRQQLEKSILFTTRTLSNWKPESSLVFRHLQPTENAPYFILLQHGRLWRIGPYLTFPIQVHSDVSSKNWNNFYECTPATAGTPVLNPESGEVSAEALALIRGIPGDRFPSFQVFCDSSREMFLIREALKQENIRHAFTTKTDDSPVGFAFRENVNYESD